jgi:DNA-binding response OmpR family regulator
VDWVRDAEAAEATLRSERFDLVLLDLGLPRGSGMDVLRGQRTRGDTTPVLVLTARAGPGDRVAGLDAGADDYLVKPFELDELGARMRAVLRRVKPTAEAPGELSVGPVRIEIGSRRVWLDGAELSLSRKEFDLLVELVSHAGEVVTREDLISRVWDENWFGSTKTLDVHVGWLRGKLADDASAPRLIHTVRGVGFRLDPPA